MPISPPVSNILQDPSFNPIAGVSVTISDSTTGALSSIYNADGTGKANPFVTGPTGDATFYADDGVYLRTCRIGGRTYSTDSLIVGTPAQFRGYPGAAGNVAITRAQLKAGPAATATPGDIWQLSDPTGDILFKATAGSPPMFDPGEDQYVVVSPTLYFARILGETDAVAAIEASNALLRRHDEQLNEVRSATAKAFTPGRLFTPGVLGVWFDPTDITTLFKDVAGTQPAAIGDTVAFIRDKSGNGYHATCPTASARPTVTSDGNYTRLTFGGSHYLQANFANTFSIAFDRVSCLQPTAWSDLAYFYGGGGGLNAQTPDVGVLLQAGASPQAIMFAGTRSTSFAIPVAQTSTVTEHFFVSNSRVRLDNSASTYVGNVSDGGPLGVTIGCSGGGTNFAQFHFYGMVMIDRQLTETELSLTNQYVSRNSMPLSLVDIGDSTEASNPSSHPMPPVFSFAPDVNLNLVAHAGDTIEVQQQKFDALTSAAKLAATAVWIGVGLNNVPNLLGADPALSALPLATTMASLQALITDIRAQVSPYCRIYIRTMTPANGRWDQLSGNPTVTAFLKWKWAEMNKAIAGYGPYAITGVDGRVTRHTYLLQGRPGDPNYIGPGYLSKDFDVDNDHIHPSFWGRRIIYNCDRDLLAADGLLKPF